MNNFKRTILPCSIEIYQHTSPFGQHEWNKVQCAKFPKHDIGSHYDTTSTIYLQKILTTSAKPCQDSQKFTQNLQASGSNSSKLHATCFVWIWKRFSFKRDVKKKNIRTKRVVPQHRKPRDPHTIRRPKPSTHSSSTFQPQHCAEFTKHNTGVRAIRAIDANVNTSTWVPWAALARPAPARGWLRLRALGVRRGATVRYVLLQRACGRRRRRVGTAPLPTRIWERAAAGKTGCCGRGGCRFMRRICGFFEKFVLVDFSSFGGGGGDGRQVVPFTFCVFLHSYVSVGSPKL